MRKILLAAIVAGSFLFVGAGSALATSITDHWIDPSGNILMNDGTDGGVVDYQYFHYITPPYDIGIDTLTSANLTISLDDGTDNGNSFKYGLDLAGTGFGGSAIQVNGDYTLSVGFSLLSDGELKVNIHRQAGSFYFVESFLFAEWTDGSVVEEEEIIGNDLLPTPEPATMLLLGTGLIGVAGAARRKKKLV